MQDRRHEHFRMVVKAEGNHNDVDNEQYNVKKEEYQPDGIEALESVRHCNMCVVSRKSQLWGSVVFVPSYSTLAMPPVAIVIVKNVHV